MGKGEISRRTLNVLQSGRLRAMAEMTRENMRHAIAVDQSATGAAAVVEKACAEAESLVNDAKEGDAPKLGCTAGCEWCCYEKVLVYAPEVLRIADFVRKNFTDEQQASLFQRVKETDATTRGQPGEERVRSPVRCPLLVDGLCSVYAVRPVACRGASSFDADLCKRALTDRDAGSIPNYQPQFLILGQAGMGFRAGAFQAEVEGRSLELVAALRIALERPNAGERWVRGLPVFSQAIDQEANADMVEIDAMMRRHP